MSWAKIWLVILLETTGAAAPRETLVVATYNLANYGPADRRTGRGFMRDYPKPEAEKAALRTVIGALNADVLALQEMGSNAHLEELRHDLRSEGVNFAFRALIEAEDHERHVALLSKLPLKAVRLHRNLDFPYLGARERVKRGLLEAVIATPAGDLTLFVVHLKSHLTERKEDRESATRRLSEALAVRDCILRIVLDPGRALFIVLGDFNDGSHSTTLQRLERAGGKIVAFRLPAADGRGETWTEAWPKGDIYAQLDHILVSPGLRRNVVAGLAHIYDGPGVSSASDHRPVHARLDFGAEKTISPPPSLAQTGPHRSP
jgi:endonuclease/exonuclease/phosphatase family metal-dependent hydrolase